MATFKTSAKEITIRDPLFPYGRGARPLILHHQTRDGEWVSGSITGIETNRPIISASFRLSDDDYIALYNFITITIGDGLVKFVYWDSNTVGVDGSYLMTYLGGLDTAQEIKRTNYNEVTINMEGRLRIHRNAP